MRVLSKALFSTCECINFQVARSFSMQCKLLQNAQQISVPAPETEYVPASPKIENLVTEISKLTLIEVSELSSALKKRLNIPDTPMMAFGAAPVAAPAAAAEDEEPVQQQAVKSSFNVKLVKFDDSKKVALIKEIKGLLTDMNLVQAKKFVESVPVVVKADLAKDEAEKLKATLEKIGGECVIE